MLSGHSLVKFLRKDLGMRARRRARISSQLLEGTLATACAQGRSNDFDVRAREAKRGSVVWTC
eukprot:2984764-Pyramimonas_sp.AAC.1